MTLRASDVEGPPSVPTYTPTAADTPTDVQEVSSPTDPGPDNQLGLEEEDHEARLGIF